MTKYLNCWNTLCGYKIHSINNKRGLYVNNITNDGGWRESKNRGSKCLKIKGKINIYNAKFSM